jgi:hypothetical protein
VASAPEHAPASLRLSPPADGHEAEVPIALVRGAYLGLVLEENGTDQRVQGALLDLEGRDGSDYLDVLHRALWGGTVGSSKDWLAASEHLLFEERGRDGYLVGPLRPGPYTLRVEHPAYAPLVRKLTVIDPAETLVHDVGSGKDRLYGRPVTPIVFLLDPR